VTGLATARVAAATHRLIASRYPTVGVFDDLATSREDIEAAYILESLTNDRLSVVAGRLRLLPDGEIVQGPGATMVMAAFTHADEAGGRFTDGRLGAWYAAFTVDTAIAETLHHATRRLNLSDGAFPSAMQMRELVAKIDCSLVDIRSRKANLPDCYDLASYVASQKLATNLRWPDQGEGANGLVYDSVRQAGGVNVCVYKPSLVRLPVVQADHYQYRWDGAGVATVFRLTNVDEGRSHP
jgi:hypothetical protein